MSNGKMSDALDYNLNNLDERMKLVEQIIDANDNAIVDFYDNHYNPHISQTGFLSENTKMGKDLEAIASYLLYAKDVEAEDLITEHKSKRNNTRETSMEKFQAYASNESKEEKTKMKLVKLKVNKEDRIKYKELNETGKVISTFTQMIKTGKDTKGNPLTEKEIRKLKWIRTDIQKDEIAIKKELKGYIEFQSIMKSEKDMTALAHTRYDDVETIRVLIENYEKLKTLSENDTHGYLKIILFDLDNLIEKTEFKDYIKDVLKWKIENIQYDDMIESLKEIHNISINKPKLSNLTRKVIPTMIVETYKQQKEDWVYTYIMKGDYKTCLNCKNNYLATTKYFSPNSKGLRPVCRKCRNSKSKTKQVAKNV